jgi:adenosylhomocysteine nucleosidase
MDPERVAACATRTEARAARRFAARTAVVGIGARRGAPDGALISFGLAGALHDGLACGDVLDATRVVDVDGNVLWEGRPLGLSRARVGTILASDVVVDDPEDRRRLHEATGADAVDLESGPLARTGRLAGCVRAISDTPSRTLGPLGKTVGSDGRVEWTGLMRALARPRATRRALGGVRRALRSLEESAV